MIINRDMINKALSWFYGMESGMIKKIKKKVYQKKKTENFISVLKTIIGSVIFKKKNGVMEEFNKWDEMEYMDKDASGKYYVKRSVFHDMRRAFNMPETEVWLLDFCEVAKSFRKVKTGFELPAEQYDNIVACIEKYIEDVYLMPLEKKKVSVLHEEVLHEEVLHEEVLHEEVLHEEVLHDELVVYVVGEVDVSEEMDTMYWKDFNPELNE
jgi:hypothetical protein